MPADSGSRPNTRCGPKPQTIVFSSSRGTQALALFFRGSTPGAFMV